MAEFEDEMLPQDEIPAPQVPQSTPAYVGPIGGPASGVVDALSVGRLRRARIPPGLNFPGDDETVIALGKLSHEKYVQFEFAATLQEKLKLLALSRKAIPEEQAASRTHSEASGGKLNIIRDLHKIHPIVRAAAIGWVDLAKLSSVTDLVRVHTALAQKQVEPRQWVDADLKFDRMDAKLIEFNADAPTRGWTRDLIKSSLRGQAGVKKHYLPQGLWWELLQGCDSFSASPLDKTFTIAGTTYRVDELSRIEDSDFERFVGTLRRVCKGEIVPVRMSRYDMYAIGYLTMEFTNDMSVQKVVLRPAMGSATLSPLYRTESDHIRERITEAFRVCVNDLGALSFCSARTQWSHYVAYVYAYALASGTLPKLDPAVKFYEDVANWDNAVESVVRKAEAAAADIWEKSADNRARAHSASGNPALYDSKYWVSLQHAHEGTEHRRSLVDAKCQTLTRMMDICEGSFGHPHLDGLTELRYLMSKLGKAYLIDGIDVVGASAGAFNARAFKAMLPPDVRVRFYHNGADKKIEGDIELLPFKEKTGPEPQGKLIIDVGVGRSAKSDIQNLKSTWLCKWPAVISLYLPTATFRTTTYEDGETVLPAGIKKFFESYGQVYFFSTLRWHQPQFYVVARNKLAGPNSWSSASMPGDPDAGFRDGPCAKWVNFVTHRAALSQVGNLWVNTCDRLGVRMAPPFHAATHLKGMIATFEYGYATMRATKTYSTMFGGAQFQESEKIKSVPAHQYEVQAQKDDLEAEGGSVFDKVVPAAEPTTTKGKELAAGERKRRKADAGSSGGLAATPDIMAGLRSEFTRLTSHEREQLLFPTPDARLGLENATAALTAIPMQEEDD